MRGGELDPATLARARGGDPRAFRALYEHHADAVYAFLRRMLREPAATEDAVQDAFVRVLGALPGFDPAGPARLSTWIFTIARRVALTALERRPPPPVPPPPAPDQPILRLAIEAAVAALPDVLRSTFVLREACDLGYEELAVVEGIDVGTVKSRLHRARALLQAALQDERPEPGTSERSGHGTRATR